MQGGAFGFPARDKLFLLLADVSTTKTATFIAPYTGWYLVSGIAGGGAGSGSYGGTAGAYCIRSPFYLKTGAKYSVSVGRGGGSGGAIAGDTSITDASGNVLLTLLHGAIGGNGTSTSGEDGMAGFTDFPDTLYRAGGGAALSIGRYHGSGGGRSADGAPGALAIEFPENILAG